MNKSKWICAVLIAVLALGLPLAALAQLKVDQPAREPYPYPGSAASAAASAPPDPELEPSDGDKVGAAFLNAAYVPGKVILCGIGTLTSAFVMGITFGSGYRAAIGVFKEGCHGTWVLTPEHVSGKIPPKEDVD